MMIANGRSPQNHVEFAALGKRVLLILNNFFGSFIVIRAFSFQPSALLASYLISPFSCLLSSDSYPSNPTVSFRREADSGGCSTVAVGNEAASAASPSG